jgi:hypothetical protein
MGKKDYSDFITNNIYHERKETTMFELEDDYVSYDDKAARFNEKFGEIYQRRLEELQKYLKSDPSRLNPPHPIEYQARQFVVDVFYGLTGLNYDDWARNGGNIEERYVNLRIMLGEIKYEDRTR